MVDRLPQTETLDKLYLEWSQFTHVRTGRELRLISTLEQIARSNPNKFDNLVEHLDWIVKLADEAVSEYQNWRWE